MWSVLLLFIARIAVPTLITICLSCCLDYAFALNAKTTFSHVTVLATNMTASLDFYHKIGFAIDKSRPEMGFDGVWLHIPTSDTTASHISIHLVQTERSAGRTLNQSVSIYGSEHFAISLQGRMNKIIEELRKLNIPLCLGAPRPNDFVDQTFVSDPDGNLIEISTQDDNYITITALEASLRHTSKDSPAYSSTVSKLERLYAIVTDQLVLDFREGLAKYGSFKTMSDKNLRPSKTSLSTGKKMGAAFGNPLGTAAATDILHQGGSAIDAMIAGNLVMTVVEPMNCGLGGDFFAMIHKRKSGKETKDTIYGWNGSGFTSAKLTMEGMVQQLHAAGYNGSDSKYLAAGNSPIPVQGIFAANTIPATAASWCHLHAMHGNLPWETLFSQAIHYALNGFPVSIHSRKNWDHLHRFVDTFSLTSSIFTAKQFYDFMRVFGIGSIGPLPGERYRNPILGKTLIDLQKRGCNEFYGPMGQAMADYYIRARSTILQAEDFRKAQQSVQEMISLLQRKIKKDQDFSWVNLSPTSLSLSSTATSLSHPMPPLTCTFMVDGETYSIQTVGENSQAFTACYILKILEVAIASTSLFRQEKAYRLFVHVIAKRLVSGVILTRLGGDNVVDHGSKNRWDMKDWLGITTKELCQLIEDSYRRRQPFPMDRFHLVAPTGNTDINLSRNVSQNSLTGIRYPQSNTLSEDRQPGGAGKRVRSFRKSQAMRRGYKGLMKAQDTMPGDTVAMAVTDAQGLSVAALQSLGGAFGSGITVPILGFALQNRGSAFAIHQGHVAYSSSQQSSSSSSTAYRNGFAAQKRPLHTLSPWILCNHNGSRLLAIKGGDRQPYVFTQLLVNSLVLGLSVENAVDAPRFRHVLPQDPSPSNPLRHLQFLERRRRKVNANVWDWAWLRNTTVEFEPGYDLTTHDVSILSDLGINVLIRYPTDSFEDSGFGLIQLISKVEGGTVQAIADTLRKPGSTFAG